MTREEQIKAAAKKTTGLFSYRNGYSTVEDAFIAGAEWADANPCMPGMVVKIPERSREEIKELLDNWKGTIVAGGDISISPWISVEERLPEVNQQVYAAIPNLCGTEYATLEYLGDNRWRQDTTEYTYEFSEGVTYWMPIPELPLPKEGV